MINLGHKNVVVFLWTPLEHGKRSSLNLFLVESYSMKNFEIKPNEKIQGHANHLLTIKFKKRHIFLKNKKNILWIFCSFPHISNKQHTSLHFNCFLTFSFFTSCFSGPSFLHPFISTLCHCNTPSKINFKRKKEEKEKSISS